jgi:hypothetical protein
MLTHTIRGWAKRRAMTGNILISANPFTVVTGSSMFVNRPEVSSASLSMVMGLEVTDANFLARTTTAARRLPSTIPAG